MFTLTSSVHSVLGVASLVISLRTIKFAFFFFSSRRRHTRLQGDWSSDVCSSDLVGARLHSGTGRIISFRMRPLSIAERNLDRKSVVVGKECRSRWSPYH